MFVENLTESTKNNFVSVEMASGSQASNVSEVPENAPTSRLEADGDVFHDAVDVDVDVDSRGLSDRSEARDPLDDADKIESGE